MSQHEAASAGAGPKVSFTDLSAARKSIAVEVPADAVAAEYERACRKYARNLRVPGFRQGKVPLEIVRQRFGREIQQETVEHVIHEAMERAVKGASLRPLRAPVLKDYTHAPGGPLKFTAEVEVMPKVTVKGRDAIRIKVADPAVTDRMVGEALEVLRERAARFEPVEGRGLGPGDHVLADVKGEVLDEADRRIDEDSVLFEIGSGGPHPELTEHLRDARPGETRAFTVTYSDDHPAERMAGRRIAYRIGVREIKRKVLPDLDDEFARDLGESAGLEDLKSKVSADLMQHERRRAREDARSKALDRLLEENADIEVPEALVDEEVDRRVADIAHTLSLQGVDPKQARVDWDEIRKKQRDAAARSVRAMILLDAMAEEEKISVSPEALDLTVAAEAARRRQPAEAFRAKLAKDGRLARIEKQLLRDKILDFLLVTANT